MDIVSTESHRYPTVSMQIVLKHHRGYTMYNKENNGFVYVCEGNRVEISFKFTYLHLELAIIRIPSIPSLQHQPTYISIIHIS